MRKHFLSIAATGFTLFLAPLACHAQAVQGPVTPGPAQGRPEGGGRGGFGFSLDLGLLVRGVQSLMADSRYNSPDSSTQRRHEPGQVILAWPSDDAAGTAPIEASIAASGGTTLNRTELGSLGMTMVVLGFADSSLASAAVIRLRSAHPTLSADLHAMAYPMQDSGTPGKQYAHDLLKAPAQGGVKLASALLVGMVDTEVSNAGTLALASFKARRMFPDSDKPAASDHGNGVAAVMAATGHGFEGLAQGAHLRSASVMREVAPGINASNTMLIAQALDWLASENVRVINLSIGSAHDEVLAKVIGMVQALGIVLVAAAGNGGPQAQPSYPAAYPGVIAATAVDAQKRLYARANRGSYIAIAAPGVDVWLPVAEKGDKGKYMSGTSFASPFVAAAVAQALAQANTQTNTAGDAQPKAPAGSGNAASQMLLETLCSKANSLGVPSAEQGCGLLQM